LARWLIIVPMVLLLLFGCSHLALLAAPPLPTADTRSKLQANYSPWLLATIPAINPDIVTAVAHDQATEVPAPVTVTASFWSTPQPTSMSVVTNGATNSVPATAAGSTPLSPTQTATRLATSTRTSTAKATVTLTRTPFPTFTRTATATRTPAPIPTRTPTAAPTSTFTPIPPTNTSAPPPPTVTRTRTRTPTPTSTLTPTPTPTVSNTPGASPTPSDTATPTPSPSATPTFTSTPTLVGPLHLGGLTGASAKVGNKWKAIVTITVHDANHNPVANASVSGAWDYPTGSAACLTNGSGQCSVSSKNLKQNKASVTFTVSNMTQGAWGYNPAANDVGISITVNTPWP
jgi:hypothetical protein